MGEGQEMHLHVEDTQLCPRAPTSAGVHVRLLRQHKATCLGKHSHSDFQAS